MKLPTKTFTILATSLLVATAASAGNYQVDTTHSEVSFKVSHLGISTVTGYFTDFNASFDLDPEKLLTPDVAIVGLVHVSNAIGTINPVRECIELAHARGIPVLLDGAQAGPHMPIDVQDLDCDFYCVAGSSTPT